MMLFSQVLAIRSLPIRITTEITSKPKVMIRNNINVIFATKKVILLKIVLNTRNNLKKKQVRNKKLHFVS